GAAASALPRPHASVEPDAHRAAARGRQRRVARRQHGHVRGGLSMRRFVAAVLAAALASSAAVANDDLVFAAQHGNDEAAYALLESGVPVDSTSDDGTRALHWAVHHGRVELVRRLIEAGADVHAPNDYGATPMSEAAVRGSADI